MVEDTLDLGGARSLRFKVHSSKVHVKEGPYILDKGATKGQKAKLKGQLTLRSLHVDTKARWLKQLFCDSATTRMYNFMDVQAYARRYTVEFMQGERFRCRRSSVANALRFGSISAARAVVTVIGTESSPLLVFQRKTS